MKVIKIIDKLLHNRIFSRIASVTLSVKRALMPYANGEGSDQPAHRRGLISACSVSRYILQGQMIL